MPRKPQGSVLLADDEPLLVRLVRRVLEGAGHRVSTAASPTAVCEALEGDDPPQVAVLDATLVRRMGEDVLRRLLASPGCPAIILISGAELEPDLHRLLARQGGRFLPKPFEPVQLVRAVADALAAKPAG